MSDRELGKGREVEKVQSRRILVVDDDEDIRNSLAELLEMEGHRVTVAADGMQAYEMAARGQSDIVLLDIGLPKLNGYEVAEKIRAQPWGRGLSLVAITGWGQEEDRQRCQAAGFDCHLVKPVDLQSINEILADIPRKV